MAKAGKRTGRLQGIIAENVRALRVSKGISQEELAEISGYHRTYVGMIERGERNISIATLEALAGSLGVEPKRLLEYDSGSDQPSK
jgi:transcriptional regulator with XRE-family HTH domain